MSTNNRECALVDQELSKQRCDFTLLQFFCANRRREWDLWHDEDLVGLQLDVGKVFGVYVVDPSNHEDERASIRLYDRVCRETRRPLIVF
jgi:hypothetical protein